jgi:hypothetical protein
MPNRRAPMRRGQGFKSTGKPLRSGRLQQKPKNAYERQLDRMRPVIRRRSKGRCEIGLPGCQRVARHPHHRKLRSRGGTNDADNLLDACDHCHDWAHAHPAIATRLGLQIPSRAPVGPISEVREAVAKFILDGPEHPR